MTQLPRLRQSDLGVVALLFVSLVLGGAIAAQSHAGFLTRTLELAAVFGVVAFVTLFVRRRTADPLAGMIHRLATGTAGIDAMTAQVARDAHSLAAATSRQAATIQETAATVEQLASMTQRNAEHASETDHLMGETRTTVTQANESMAGLFDAIQEITRCSAETSRIVRTIDEIAFQTNLLALNAAVEAARAGQHGAGFAVVADEVRTLAHRAAEAARETGALIDRTNEQVAQAGALVARTRERFLDVNEHVSRSGDFVSRIAAASTEQAQGIDQLNVSVTEIDNVMQQTVANAEHSAGAAEQMSAQTRDMSTVIEQLRVLVNARAVEATEDEVASKRVHLRIAVNRLVAESYAAWTKTVPAGEIRDFSGPYANRPTVDLVLQVQALMAGGLNDFDYELHLAPNYGRAWNEVVQGYTDLSAETVWDTDVAALRNEVILTSPIIRNGEFEKGLYALPSNEAMLKVASLDDVRAMAGATVVSWATDTRALEAMRLRRIERVFREEGLFPLIERRRADFTLLEFASTPDMSVTRDGVRLVPVPGCKVSLPGSRSWAIARTSPHADLLASVLERGVQALRHEGRFETAYRQSGFFNQKVAHWKRLI